MIEASRGWLAPGRQGTPGMDVVEPGVGPDRWPRPEQGDREEAAMTGSHGRHGHGGHADGRPDNAQRIFWALILTGGFMFAEVVGGVISGSLALLADAAHMLVDTVALLFAWIAFKLSSRPADRSRTYGYHRFPVLAAFANGISLLFIVGWIFTEAADRLANPTDVLAGPMLVVAVLGLVVNITAYVVLRGAAIEPISMSGERCSTSWATCSVRRAAACAALTIMATGWMQIDPLLSILVGLFVLRSAWFLLKDAGARPAGGRARAAGGAGDRPRSRGKC